MAFSIRDSSSFKCCSWRHQAVQPLLTLAAFPFFFSFGFIYFWLHWVSVAAGKLSLVHCRGLWLGWLLSLPSTGSSACGLLSMQAAVVWGAWAWLPWDMWNLPRLGVELLSPALAGGFLTTEAPKKSRFFYTLDFYTRFPLIKGF